MQEFICSPELTVLLFHAQSKLPTDSVCNTIDYLACLCPVHAPITIKKMKQAHPTFRFLWQLWMLTWSRGRSLAWRSQFVDWEVLTKQRLRDHPRCSSGWVDTVEGMEIMSTPQTKLIRFLRVRPSTLSEDVVPLQLSCAHLRIFPDVVPKPNAPWRTRDQPTGGQE